MSSNELKQDCGEFYFVKNGFPGTPFGWFFCPKSSHGVRFRRSAQEGEAQDHPS
jgi:hypothetical protein